MTQTNKDLRFSEVFKKHQRIIHNFHSLDFYQLPVTYFAQSRFQIITLLTMRFPCLALLLVLASAVTAESAKKKAKPSSGSQVVDDVMDKASEYMGDIVDAVTDTLHLDDDVELEDEENVGEEVVTPKKPAAKEEGKTKSSSSSKKTSSGADTVKNASKAPVQEQTQPERMDNPLFSILGSFLGLSADNIQGIIEAVIKVVFNMLKDANPEALIKVYNMFRNFSQQRNTSGSQE